MPITPNTACAVSSMSVRRRSALAHYQADHQGKGGDDLEIEQCLDADAADLARILDVGNA
jgi:hypothetical protein